MDRLKRKRSQTFAASEKKTLVDLVESHFSIVECKKTDAFSMRQKIKEWQKIAEEFNAISSLYRRDALVLRKCWENLKKRAKQGHIMGTGGPSKNFKEDPLNEKVLELVKPRVSEFINVLDCDGAQVLAEVSECIPKAEIIDTLNPNKNADEHAIQINILRIQEKRENELLEIQKLIRQQEQIKLEILKLQLNKLKQ